MDFVKNLFTKTVFNNSSHVTIKRNENPKPSIEEISKEINNDNKLDPNTDRNSDQNNINNSNDVENKTLSELREFETILNKYNINMNRNWRDFNEIDTIIDQVTEDDPSDTRINCNVESEHNYSIPNKPFASPIQILTNESNFQNTFNLETTNIIETVELVHVANVDSESIKETEEPLRYNAFGVVTIDTTNTVIINNEPNPHNIDSNSMASVSRPSVGRQTIVHDETVVDDSKTIKRASNSLDVQDNSDFIDNKHNIFDCFLAKDMFEIPNNDFNINVSINNNIIANEQNIIELNTDKVEKDIDVISISSDDIETESQHIQMEVGTSDIEDGYNSSDFEFIDEEEAKKCDLFKNINKSAQYFDNFNKPVETINISREYDENAIIYDYFETLTPSQNRKLPNDNEYYNMFRENSIQRHSIQKENKSVCPILTMQVEFGAIEMITNQDNELLEDAMDSAKAIRSMYPNENRNKRRRQSNIKLPSNC